VQVLVSALVLAQFQGRGYCGRCRFPVVLLVHIRCRVSEEMTNILQILVGDLATLNNRAAWD
jgi:hypothetical protein